MGPRPSPPPGVPTSPGQSGRRLDSWKDIAAYLHRDIRTVQRWEAHGLPVHRLRHTARGRVFAFANEVDRWWEVSGTDAEPPEFVAGPDGDTTP